VACKVYVDAGFEGAEDFTVRQSSDDRRELLLVPPANQYTLQWQAFSEAIQGGKPVKNDVHSALANMRAIDAIFRSAQTGRWEAP
jgi:predicted dehydrogenase